MSKRIKVAEVITRMDWGGSPDIVRLICAHLDRTLYDATLVTGAAGHLSDKTKTFLNAFESKIITVSALQRDVCIFADIKAFWQLYSLFRKERFDIVHTHTAKAGILGRLAARLAGGAKIVHTPHGHNFYGYFGFCFSKIIILSEWFLSRFTDRIVVFTELEKQDFLRYKISDARNTSVIYQGIELDACLTRNKDNPEMRSRFGFNEKDPVVGMVGRLEHVKGGKYFIQAAKAVNEQFPKTKFIVVGEGSLRKSLEEQVSALGLTRQFIFTGWKDDMPGVLSVLDVLVLPSLNEAVGMVLIEAMASQVAVVATKVGGIPEVVQDKLTGLLVPPADAHSLSRAIKYLLGSEPERLRMAERGRGWVKDKFSVDQMIRNISSLYASLGDGSRLKAEVSPKKGTV